MSRRIRLLAAALFVSLALGTTACANMTAPQPICEDAPASGTCPVFDGAAGSGT